MPQVHFAKKAIDAFEVSPVLRWRRASDEIGAAMTEPATREELAQLRCPFELLPRTTDSIPTSMKGNAQHYLTGQQFEESLAKAPGPAIGCTIPQTILS